MPWSPDAVFVEGLNFFSASVALLQAPDWQRPSPCSGWTTLDVLGHVGSAVGFGTDLLSGRRPEWSPSDPPGAAVVGDPHAWWHSLEGPAREAVAAVDVTVAVDSPVGRRTIGDGLSFPALDLFVHAWDMARSVGVDITIPSEAIEFARGIFEPVPEEQLRSPRVFGTAVAPSTDASPSDAFISWTGRDPRWAPPTGD